MARKKADEVSEEAITHTHRGIGKKAVETELKKVEKVEETVAEAEKEIAEEIEEAGEKKVKKVKKEKGEEGGEKSVEQTLAEKKKKLLEKVKALKEKVSGETVSSEDLKEKVKEKKKDPLLPLDDYVKSGIYLGTKVVTPDMRPFVYRRRADGLAIFNTDLIDDFLKEGIAYLSQYEAKDVILVCKRQAGWKAAKMFSEFTGIRVFSKKYPAGILTNTDLPDFFENELTIVCDSWLDKNALADTLKVKKKVLMICDTNNFGKGADKFIIGNNKSGKSLGLMFYLLARGYCKNKRPEVVDHIPELDDWMGED